MAIQVLPPSGDSATTDPSRSSGCWSHTVAATTQVHVM